MSNELRFIKWVRFFERNSIVKWVIFFGSFCGLWDFLLNNLKLKKDLMISAGTYGWVCKSYMSEKIFSKKCFYILVQFSFLGDWFFNVDQPWRPTFLLLYFVCGTRLPTDSAGFLDEISKSLFCPSFCLSSCLLDHSF